MKGARVGPSNGNRDWFDSRFCGTRRGFDIAGVKRKDGGHWFWDGSGGLLRFESDSSCDVAELF